MTYKHLIKTAITGLETNRSRSILTIIGIVIGITAIMLVMSLGAGAQNLILSQVQGLGSNTIAVIPGLVSTSPSQIAANLYSDSLKPADLTALESKANVPGLASIMPVVLGSYTSSYQSNTYQVTIFGGTDLVASIFDLTPASGQFFTSDDVTSQSKVVVIGSKVASNLFGNDNPINQQISINGVSFQVVGVLPSSGGGSLFDFDDMTIMPYTTAQTYLLGIKYFNRLGDAPKEPPQPSPVCVMSALYARFACMWFSLW